MFARKQKRTILMFLSLFSVVRGYNILIIVIAQYLASIYIMAMGKTIREIILDSYLLAIVLSSALTIAAGYIINNFYDAEKDRINRPNKTMLDSIIGQRTKISAYFILNFLSVIAASYVSFRAVVFFSGYIFGIWFYSHKLKKIPLWGNLTSAILSITPFFAVFVYYKNFDAVIFVHATFLFLLILIREFIKDLENLQGDLMQNYKTIPVLYGEKTSKRIVIFLVGLTCIPTYFLISQFDIGHMYYYFYHSIVLLCFFIFLLWKAQQKKQYVLLHNGIKYIIVSGVFGILLIDIQLLFNIIL